jgi:hypothetical protein
MKYSKTINLFLAHRDNFLGHPDPPRGVPLKRTLTDFDKTGNFCVAQSGNYHVAATGIILNINIPVVA